jgi:chromate reductase
MRLFLICGSTRQNSTNAAVLDVIRRTTPTGSRAVVYQDLSELPAFNPDADNDPLPPLVAQLWAQIAGADAVVISSPEYAGTLPGSVKNLLDWMVGGTEMTDKSVAWINVAAPGRGRGAVTTLESVLGYIGASVVTDACLTVPVSPRSVDADGVLTDVPAIDQLSGIWRILAAATRRADHAGGDD